jgi:hypothetical protein
MQDAYEEFLNLPNSEVLPNLKMLEEKEEAYYKQAQDAYKACRAWDADTEKVLATDYHNNEYDNFHFYDICMECGMYYRSIYWFRPKGSSIARCLGTKY